MPRIHYREQSQLLLAYASVSKSLGEPTRDLPPPHPRITMYP